jgi:hypothetical protein
MARLSNPGKRKFRPGGYTHMNAAAFAYARATSIVNALELLALHGDKATVPLGGQSLMPAMNLRRISPDIAVDIGSLAELRGVAVRRDVLVFDALTRHVGVADAGNGAGGQGSRRGRWGGCGRCRC